MRDSTHLESNLDNSVPSRIASSDQHPAAPVAPGAVLSERKPTAKPDKPKLKWRTTERVRLVAMCQPAVRMFSVSVWTSDDGADSKVDPVLALVYTTRRCFSKRMREEHFEDGSDIESEEELMERGWTFREEREQVSPQIYDCDYGVVSVDDELLKTEDSASEICVLPWPFDPQRDEAEFKTVVERLKQHLLRRRKNKFSNGHEPDSACGSSPQCPPEP